MMLIHRHGSPCPFCSTSDVRPSRPRRLEWLLGLLSIRPHRCRLCNLRYWTLNLRTAPRLLLAVVVLAGAGLLLWWMLTAAALMGTPG